MAAATYDYRPTVLSARSTKRFSYPLASAFSAPVSPIHSSESSPLFVALSSASSPGLVGSSKSLPGLSLALEAAVREAMPDSIGSADSEDPATPKAFQRDGPLTPRTAVQQQKSMGDLKRSASMPAVPVDAIKEEIAFPSPSGSFRAPAGSEVAAIRERLRGQSESPSRSRPRISVDIHSRGKKRSSSMGSASGSPPPDAKAVLSPASRLRNYSLRDDGSPTSSQVMSAVSSSARSSLADWSSSNRPPSRPASGYADPVVTVTPGLARRLSMSASRRGSENVVPQVKPIKVRDYAFKQTDPRFWGEGMQASLPAHSRTSSGLWTSSSNSSSRAQLQSWDEVANDVQEGLTSRGSTTTFSWGFITSHAEAEAVDQMAESPVPEEESDSDGIVDLGPIPEGGALYVATYSFEPEADQEMKLDEGEVVRVYERICQGWVVAGRLKAAGDSQGDEETGLVPENYLAPFRHDDL